MNMILAINMEMIGLSIAIFLGIILVLVILLLVAKNYLSPSGPVKVTLNGEKEIEVMKNINNMQMKWWDNFKLDVPTWYKGIL